MLLLILTSEIVLIWAPFVGNNGKFLGFRGNYVVQKMVCPNFGELFVRLTQDLGSFDTWGSGGRGHVGISVTFLCLFGLN